MSAEHLPTETRSVETIRGAQALRALLYGGDTLVVRDLATLLASLDAAAFENAALRLLVGIAADAVATGNLMLAKDVLAQAREQTGPGAELLAELQRLRATVVELHGAFLELLERAAAWDAAITNLNGVKDAEDALRAIVARFRIPCEGGG